MLNVDREGAVLPLLNRLPFTYQPSWTVTTCRHVWVNKYYYTSPATWSQAVMHVPSVIGKVTFCEAESQFLRLAVRVKLTMCGLGVQYLTFNFHAKLGNVPHIGSVVRVYN